MKVTVVAIFLLLFILFGAIYNGLVMRRMTDILFSCLEQIPDDTNAMETADREALMREAQRLAVAWNDIFPYLTYTVGYTALNRADDAVLSLCSYIGSEAYSDAVHAHKTLRDALRRIRENEMLSPGSVF